MKTEKDFQKKEINSELYKVCPDCDGEGLLNDEVCIKCNGTGQVLKNHEKVKFKRTLL